MKPLFERLFAVAQYLLPQHLISRLAGRLATSEVPWLKTLLIRSFMGRFRVNLDEAETSDPDRFRTFNAFFTRTLKPDARPIAPGPDQLASPADGVVSQLGRLRGGDLLQAKGRRYSLFELVGGDGLLASQFSNGHYATIYLSPKDYHRVHMPCAGTLQSTCYVPGRLFSVNPATARTIPNLFARNERLICTFATDVGPMAVILVGAMIVAGIETTFAGRVTPQARHVTHTDYQDRRDIRLDKGVELGRFLLGSTVIVLLPEGRAALNATLTPGTPIRMGEQLGTLHSERTGPE